MRSQNISCDLLLFCILLLFFIGPGHTDLAPICLENHSLKAAVSSYLGQYSDTAAVQEFEPISSWQTCKVTNTESVFDNSYVFSENFNEDIGAWDVSRVTKMKWMFFRANSFNSDISAWDVSSVQDTEGAFSYTMKFNADISQWDVSSLTNMFGMFARGSFNCDISGWDVGKVQDMGSAFMQNNAFNYDLSPWDISSVTTMSGMFIRASRFNQSLCWNIGGKNTHFMFKGSEGRIERLLC
uniref:BspA family leucine-rich repeat surface protein n=1 Tax=Corethron hystrix TaxID=216773 RepID=A0A7S1C160_9STRA|mmetsp:Transcript_7517/g.16288  ORF Transcript_7517/g.16288 Transcript_7517/m.16288 type:complete len:240 (+) Transcript_7517:134-853(+)